MTDKVFLFAASDRIAQRNFHRSIREGVKLSTLLPFIDSEEIRNKLQANSLDGKCYLWGTRDKKTTANSNTWRKMDEGDLVLGYADKAIVSAAYVVATFESSQIASEVWPDTEAPFNMLFFLTKPHLFNVPLTSVADYLGRAVRGFRQLNPDNVEEIIRQYSSLDDFVKREFLGNGETTKVKLVSSDVPKISYKPIPALEKLISSIASQGFVFEPWQIAAYVTALRTKPFVILAGVSGTGKSKLPKLVAEATMGKPELISVRPDWTDSSDVLGYVDLQGQFRPGMLLDLACEASQKPDMHFVCIMDEMNLARVEHYFAEVLSSIEDRRPDSRGGFESGPLLSANLREADRNWTDQVLPSNLAIVGTVNMDESTYGFSRKVLDRAFTLEFSDIDLTVWDTDGQAEISPRRWPVTAWFPRAIQLSELESLSEEERRLIDQVVEALIEVNKLLIQAQLQVGYRSRDEIALFVLHAQETASLFVTSEGDMVDPLDLALQMKILPRIVGGSNTIRRVVIQLLGWTYQDKPFESEDEAGEVLQAWSSAGHPFALEGAKYPRTAARLCLMWKRLLSEGFTSFWL